MKLMINIPDEAYELLKSKSELDNIAESIIANGTPVSNEGDLISRSELKKAIRNWFATERYYHPLDKPTNLSEVIAMTIIDNAPTVEIPENEVNCVLTMFGKCSYNETGCSDCEIKDKIRKALNERPQGKWVKSKDGYTRCDQCGSRGSAIKARFCHHCGADMRKGGAK